MKNTLSVLAGGSGLLALVNTAQYAAFVSEDWTFEALADRVVPEMNQQHMVVWHAGYTDENWNVLLCDQPTVNRSYREFIHAIEVSNRRLHLAHFEDLTMAAQFADETLPSQMHADAYVELENGRYTLTIRRMFELDEYGACAIEDADFIHFEIDLQNVGGAEQPERVNEFFWFES